MWKLVVPSFENISIESFWDLFITSNNFRHLAEIGVWRGGFAAHLLRNSDCIESYTMIDASRNLPNWNKPFNVDQKEFDAIFQEAMDATSFAAAKRFVKRGTTLEVINEIPEQSLDFVYADGDHTLRGVVIDMLSVWGKIRDGGVLAGDGFTNSVWQHGSGFAPTMVNPFAIYFAEANNSPITILPNNQFFIHKDSGASYKVINLSGVELNHSLSLSAPSLPRQKESTAINRVLVRYSKKVISSILWRTSKNYREWVHVRRTGRTFPASISETGLLFIHVPKAAGTSISLALYGNSLGHKKLSIWLSEYPKSVSKLKVFAVIRNPIDRFISAFWFLKAGGMNEMDLEFSQSHLSNMQTPDDLAKYLRNPGANKKILSYWHFMPQYDFVCDSKGNTCNCRLFLFEEMDSLQKWIESECKKSINFIKVNETKNKKNENSLNPDSQSIIEAVYQRDLGLYNKIQQAGGVL